MYLSKKARTHEWNEENNELAKKELKRREMNEKPKTKRNIPLLAGISAGVASIWYFFTK